MSVFHRVEDMMEHSSRWVLPKVRRLLSYKGALRSKLEEENEKSKNTPEGRARASGGTVHSDPKKNAEAMQLGIFETAGG